MIKRFSTFLPSLVLCTFLFNLKTLSSESINSKLGPCQNLMASYAKNSVPFDYTIENIKTGIEIEGVLPKLKKNILLKKLKTYFMNNYENVSLKSKLIWGTYKTFREDHLTYKKNNKEYVWKFTDDMSIKTTLKERSIEIVSPILRNKGDYRDLLNVLKVFKTGGMMAKPTSAGIHIHVDMSMYNIYEILIIKYLFSQIEKEFAEKLSVHTGRHRWMKFTDSAFIENINLNNIKFQNIQELIKKISPDRYEALNLHSLLKHGTVEFRIYPSTLDPEIIKFMINFSAKFIKAIRSHDKSFFDYIFNASNISLDELLSKLNFNKEETSSLFLKLENELAINLDSYKSQKAFSAGEYFYIRIAAIVLTGITTYELFQYLFNK